MQKVTWISILALGAAALTAAGLEAATIVSYGPANYVGGDKPLGTGGYNSGTDRFDTISPDASAPYSGPAFGGVLPYTGINAEIENQAGGDRIQIKSVDWGLVLFQQDGFLSGGNIQTVQFDADSRITLNVNTDAAHENHLVIRAHGTYYISGDIIVAGEQSFTPTTETWYAYDPITDPSSFTATGPGVSIVSGGIIDDIEAVGVFSNNTTTDSASEGLDFDTFTVTATLVPEPAALSLAGVAGVWLLRRCRRVR